MRIPPIAPPNFRFPYELVGEVGLVHASHPIAPLVAVVRRPRAAGARGRRVGKARNGRFQSLTPELGTRVCSPRERERITVLAPGGAPSRRRPRSSPTPSPSAVRPLGPSDPGLPLAHSRIRSLRRRERDDLGVARSWGSTGVRATKTPRSLSSNGAGQSREATLLGVVRRASDWRTCFMAISVRAGWAQPQCRPPTRAGIRGEGPS
jgi:hypothetical protein